MSECRSCSREILWVKIAKSGKLMPLDPLARLDGNIVLLASTDADGTRLAEWVARSDNPVAGTRYVSHFATCPHAASHRTAS